jgi:aminopeptidase-like protein
VTGAYGKPYTTAFTWTCTVLSLSQVRDAYIANYARSVVQETKNARVIDLPLPMPSGKDVKRGDYIVVGPDYFQVLDLDNNSTYQFQRTAYCQFVEGGAV